MFFLSRRITEGSGSLEGMLFFLMRRGWDPKNQKKKKRKSGEGHVLPT